MVSPVSLTLIFWSGAGARRGEATVRNGPPGQGDWCAVVDAIGHQIHQGLPSAFVVGAVHERPGLRPRLRLWLQATDMRPSKSSVNRLPAEIGLPPTGRPRGRRQSIMGRGFGGRRSHRDLRRGCAGRHEYIYLEPDQLGRVFVRPL